MKKFPPARTVSHVLAVSGFAALLAIAAGPARADMTIGNPFTGSARTDAWQAELGQSIPTLDTGWVDGTLNADVAGLYTFTYGAGLLAGDTGHGNSTFINEFWLDPTGAHSRLAAEAAGDFFCTQTCNLLGGGTAGPATAGASFDVTLPVGAIDYGFSYDQGGATGGPGPHTLLNGQVDDANGASLVALSPLTTNLPATGPSSPLAYVGLSDNTYPTADHDFQNQVVTVAEVPEPASLALLGAGLVGLGAIRRRKAAR